MANLRQEVSRQQQALNESKRRVSQLEAELDALRDKPIPANFQTPQDYAIAVTTHDKAIDEKLQEMGVIEDFLPLLESRLTKAQEAYAAQESVAEAYYQELVDLANQTAQAYSLAHDCYRALREKASLPPQSWWESREGSPTQALELWGISKLEPCRLVLRPSSQAVSIVFGDASAFTAKPPMQDILMEPIEEPQPVTERLWKNRPYSADPDPTRRAASMQVEEVGSVVT
jgi:hypothetical protein